MKVSISEHDLWGPGDNVVSMMPQSPGDLFVVVTIMGKVAVTWPITDRDKAINAAHVLARRARGDRPVIAKVFSLTLKEAQAMGFVPHDLFSNLTDAEHAEWAKLVHDTCVDALRTSEDPPVRADAMEILQGMGALK